MARRLNRKRLDRLEVRTLEAAESLGGPDSFQSCSEQLCQLDLRETRTLDRAITEAGLIVGDDLSWLHGIFHKQPIKPEERQGVLEVLVKLEQQTWGLVKQVLETVRVVLLVKWELPLASVETDVLRAVYGLLA